MTVTPANTLHHKGSVRGLNIAAALHHPMELFLAGEEYLTLHLHEQCGSDLGITGTKAPQMYPVEIYLDELVANQRRDPDRSMGFHSCITEAFSAADWSTWDTVHDVMRLVVNAHAMLENPDHQDVSDAEAPMTDAEAAATIRSTMHLLTSGIADTGRYDVSRRNVIDAMRNPDIRLWVESRVGPKLATAGEDLMARFARDRGRNWMVGTALALLLRPTREVSRGPNHQLPAIWQHHDGPDLYPGKRAPGRRAVPFECSSAFEHEVLAAVETLLARHRDASLPQAFDLVLEKFADIIDAARNAAVEAGLHLVAQMDGPSKWGQVPTELTLEQLPGVDGSSTLEQIIHTAWRVAAEREVRHICDQLAATAQEQVRTWTSTPCVEMWRIGTAAEAHHFAFDHIVATARDGAVVTVMPQWMSLALRQVISATRVASFGPAAATDTQQLYTQLARLAHARLEQDAPGSSVVAARFDTAQLDDLLHALRATCA